MEPDQAPLITAEPGPYKVPPLDPKGLEVEGEGQTIYAAGQGIDEGSVIDTNAGPEAPLPRPGTAQPVGPPQDLLAGMARETPALPPAPAPQPTARATAPAIVAGQSLAKSITIPPPAPAKVAVKAAPPPAAPAKKPGLVQLGAFSSKEKADAAWSALAGKAALNGFGKRIMVVESDGKTLYRLRASGGDAAELCRSLKAAGAPCTVIE
jgi:cell division protein FtsN